MSACSNRSTDSRHLKAGVGVESALVDSELLKQETTHTEEYQSKTEYAVSSFLRSTKDFAIKHGSERPSRIGDYYYELVHEQGRRFPVIVRRNLKNDNKEEILDYNKILSGVKSIGIGALLPNFAGDKLAFIIDFGDDRGRELFTLNIKAETEEKTPSSPYFIATNVHSFSWGKDNSSLYYITYEGNRPAALWLQRLSEPSSLLLKESRDDHSLSLINNYTGADLALSSASNDSTIYTLKSNYTAKLDSLFDYPGKVLQATGSISDKIWALTATHELFALSFLATSKKVITNKIVTADFAIESIQASKKGLVLFGRNGPKPVLGYVDQTTLKLKQVSLAVSSGQLTPISSQANEENGIEFFLDSLDTPRQRLKLNLADLSIQPIAEDKIAMSARQSAPDLRSMTINCKSSDATAIPISILSSNAKPKAILTYAYGAYGHTPDLSFSIGKAELARRGIIFAVAHVRGGGEYGPAWHKAGLGINKINGIEDLVASARCLRKEYGLSEKQIFLKGKSAGGLLVLSSILMHPNDFAGAIVDAPLTNLELLKSEPLIMNAALEDEEWGLSGNQYWRISPQQLLKNIKLPRLLISARLDDRLIPFKNILKFIRAFRLSTDPTNDLILNLSSHGGHLGYSENEDTLLSALDFAFIEDTL